jgi:hypothetical protein
MIPGHKPDIHPVSREGIYNLIAPPFEADGIVQVDPAAAFHAE